MRKIKISDPNSIQELVWAVVVSFLVAVGIATAVVIFVAMWWSL